jgi:hypothetical protein
VISLASLASEYRAERVDADGFDLEGEALRLATERAIRRQLGVYVRLVTSLGPESKCPNIFKGELRAAAHGVRVAERDLAQVTAMRASSAA